jgi:hypothetical protein
MPQNYKIQREKEGGSPGVCAPPHHFTCGDVRHCLVIRFA